MYINNFFLNCELHVHSFEIFAIRRKPKGFWDEKLSDECKKEESTKNQLKTFSLPFLNVVKFDWIIYFFINDLLFIYD